MSADISRLAIEELDFYVYLLVDPRDNKIFYVGKGINKRALSHEKAALQEDILENDESENLKENTIREITHTGHEVKYYILRHGLSSKEAFAVEAATIDMLNAINNDKLNTTLLSNLVAGHEAEKGLMSLEDIEIRYSAKPAVFYDPVILININSLYKDGMSAVKMLGVTRKHWRIDRMKASKIKVVCATYRGIVRGVFIADEWLPSERFKRDKRSYFNGHLAPNEIKDKYFHKNVSSYMGQNPIRYVWAK